MDDARVDDLERAVGDAFALADRLHWRSHDPFDLLLSPYLLPLQRLSPLAARAAVQVGRHSGGRLRRMLRVRPHEEPKALADYLRAAALLASTGRSWPAAYGESLAARLRHDRTGCADDGWGVAFPCASRFVNAPPNTPTAYVTIAVTQALLDAAEVFGDLGALRAARTGCGVLVDALGTFERGGRRWLRYWRTSDDPIVNVQALGAGLLARAGAVLADDGLITFADDVAETTLSAQRPDGSWPYSDDGRASFVDGFHTGFVLQGLTEYAEARPETSATVRAAIQAGLGYFKRRLVTPDGLPRGFADRRVSLDSQNVAQCVQTLVICGQGERDIAAAGRLWQRTAAGGRSPLSVRPGALIALRWSLGPGVLAAAHLLGALGSARDAAPVSVSPAEHP